MPPFFYQLVVGLAALSVLVSWRLTRPGVGQGLQWTVLVVQPLVALVVFSVVHQSTGLAQGFALLINLIFAGVVLAVSLFSFVLFRVLRWREQRRR